MTTTIKDPLWVEWADKFLAAGRDNSKVEPMGSVVAQLFAESTVLENSGSTLPPPPDIVEALEQVFLYQVFKGRAESLGLSVCLPTAVFVSMGLCRDPGTAVMYANALRRLQDVLEATDPIGTVELAVAFPNGFLTKAALHEMWGAQKHLGGCPDNFLDTVTV